MSAQKYRYGHRAAKHRPRKILVVFAVSAVIVLLGAGLVAFDLKRRVSPSVAGESRVVSQVLSESSQKLVVNEELFSMELPNDWKEVARNKSTTENSIKWQATKKGQDNRFLTLYVDTIPPNFPLNRLLPLRAQSNSISFGDISDNCATFTKGGSLNVQRAVGNLPTAAKWRDVDFICNVENVVDNVVGTGSPGNLNFVPVTGSKGTHKYFFVYTDRNIQPNYNVLYDALRSFTAK